MFSELEYLIKSHSDHEALSDQSSLRDIVADLRQVADNLGLNFALALAGAKTAADAFTTLSSFDPCI